MTDTLTSPHGTEQEESASARGETVHGSTPRDLTRRRFVGAAAATVAAAPLGLLGFERAAAAGVDTRAAGAKQAAGAKGEAERGKRRFPRSGQAVGGPAPDDGWRTTDC